jgi:hypothetical protein
MPEKSEIEWTISKWVIFKLSCSAVAIIVGLVCAALVTLHFSAVPHIYTVTAVLLIAFAALLFGEGAGNDIEIIAQGGLLASIVAAVLDAGAVIAYASDFGVGVCVFLLICLCAIVTAAGAASLAVTCLEEL